MMGSQARREPSVARKKPYGLIYAAVKGAHGREAERSAEASPPEAGAPHRDRPELARFCRRLGAVPRGARAGQAAQAVQEVVAQMAADAAGDPQAVYGELVSFCTGEEAVCGETPRCAECPVAEHCDYPVRKPTIKDLPAAERPRERLLQAGEESLSDVQLLAIVIRTGSQKATALELAGRLLSRFGSFRRLAAAAASDLTQVPGIGPAKAAQIKAALAIARRYASGRLQPGAAVTGSEQLFGYMREKLYGLKKEHFCALMLDTKHRIIREEQVAVGSLNESIVHPREAFQSAIRESAAKVIFVHNHPSGNPEPSPEDRRLTVRLCQAGNLVGIQVLDHLIVGESTYDSFAEHGLLGPQPTEPP